MPEISPEALRFREAMSRVAATVHVVTTDGAAGRHGATATSVASLTDEPPTLIVCLNLASRAHRLAKANGVVALSVLAARHKAIARAFAKPSHGRQDGRFDLGAWEPLATGAPTLADAVAVFDGRVVGETVVGTHAALFVEIDAVRIPEPETEVLIYQRRGYGPARGGVGC